MSTEPPYELSERQQEFVEAAKDQGFEVKYHYSGRGMYGRKCPAVYCDPGEFGFRGACHDSMGKQVVIYMPR